MKTLNQVWTFFNGRKTLIFTALATGYWAAVQANLLTANPKVEAVIATGISLGLVHKVVKANQV